MRILIGIVVIVAALLLIGWMTVSFTDNEARVRFNTEKIEEDTDSMIEGGRRIVDSVDESVDIEDEDEVDVKVNEVDAEVEEPQADVEVEVEEEPAGTP